MDSPLNTIRQNVCQLRCVMQHVLPLVMVCVDRTKTRARYNKSIHQCRLHIWEESETLPHGAFQFKLFPATPPKDFVRHHWQSSSHALERRHTTTCFSSNILCNQMGSTTGFHRGMHNFLELKQVLTASSTHFPAKGKGYNCVITLTHMGKMVSESWPWSINTRSYWYKWRKILAVDKTTLIQEGIKGDWQ